MRSSPNPDPRLTWQEVPDVAAQPGEVVIEVAAAGVNRADLLQAAGHYPPPPGASEILGLEVSGRIAELGRRRHVVVRRAGGVRSAVRRRVRRARRRSRRPGDAASRDGVGLHEAAALPEVACTVWSNLEMTAHLAAGQMLLIHGGGSGIGTHGIQVAKALGARVAVTASAAKLAMCSELGADVTIDYRDEDFVERIRAETDGAGADVILDIMGAKYLDRNVDALAPDGRLVVIGFQGGVDGRAQPRQADGQAGGRHLDGAAIASGGRAERQGAPSPRPWWPTSGR